MKKQTNLWIPLKTSEVYHARPGEEVRRTDSDIKKCLKSGKELKILAATCSPVDLHYPQDFKLLNEAREKLEAIIIHYCKGHGLRWPRMYRCHARKDYLPLAKRKKCIAKKIRATICRQLFKAVSLMYSG